MPSLTTVRQDFVRLGERGAERVLRMMNGKPALCERLAPDLVVRRSTAPPRHG